LRWQVDRRRLGSALTGVPDVQLAVAGRGAHVAEGGLWSVAARGLGVVGPEWLEEYDGGTQGQREQYPRRGDNYGPSVHGA
jgi:hypothetical protein